MSAQVDLTKMVVGLDSTSIAPAGFILIWRSPGDLQLTEEGRELLAKEPQIPAPHPPLPKAALKRAAAKLVSGDVNYFVRPAANGDVLVVRQLDTKAKADTTSDTDFDVRLRANLSILGQLDVVVTADQGDIGPDVERGERLRELFRTAIRTTAAQDVTRWLTRYVLPACQATPVHTSAGGAYFVPALPAAIDVLDRVRQALTSSGHALLIALPAYNSDPAICGAVIESLGAEVAAFTDGISIAESSPTVLENRREKLKVLRARVTEFTKLLATTAPDLVKKLDDLDFELALGAMRPTDPPTPA